MLASAQNLNYGEADERICDVPFLPSFFALSPPNSTPLFGGSMQSLTFQACVFQLMVHLCGKER